MPGDKIRANDFWLPLTSAPTPGMSFPTNFVYQTLQYTATQHAYTEVNISAYASGNPTLDIIWNATATTGNCTWECAIFTHAIPAGASFEAKAFATAQSATTTTAATTTDLNKTTITITNLDSIANTKACWLRVSRTGGTLATTANLLWVVFNYT